MDHEKMQHEIARTDPGVPFRANTTHTHHTWAKTFQSRPELYLRPQSLEEIKKIVNLARRCRRRLVVVGCGHSPSDITCTSSWMVNLDDYSKVLKVDKQSRTMTVEGGIRLRDLNARANEQGLTMPNLGSIHDQSIVGAMATATHGSSLRHGLLSESVRSLRILLSNGRAVRCSHEQNQDLFRAALVSLGALGIITEVEFEMTESCNIEWVQTLRPLGDILARWDTDLWRDKEFTRVWWMPYMRRAIVWSAEKTDKPQMLPAESWYGGSVGFHTYHNLLWLSNYVPWILPAVEWFVFGMQYGFSTGQCTTAVEELRTGLLMNCLYSQFVNEWALPLSKGPEAIRRLSAWINGEDGSDIPFSVKGLYVHCPVEVRVSDTTLGTSPRPFLDNTCVKEPTLYLNATLYRPYLQNPPCTARYYEAFEWLMRDMGGRPHWAKNWSFTSKEEIGDMYGENMSQWMKVRDEADPDGMFLGEWHRRSLPLATNYALQEREVTRRRAANGGQFWVGQVNGGADRAAEIKQAFSESRPDDATGTEKSYSPSASSSGESFDFLHGAEAERSTLLTGSEFEYEDEDEDTDRDERRTHGHPKEGLTGTKVFDKM